MYTKKAQNVATSGIYMIRKAEAFCAFQELLLDITSFKASKKIRVPIAIAQQDKMTLSDIADEVVDVRLVIDELLEVNVEISTIILLLCFTLRCFNNIAFR
ncbi:MAG: hypothetical protein ACXV5H_08880 [Halobacteriota archaeon]